MPSATEVARRGIVALAHVLWCGSAWIAAAEPREPTEWWRLYRGSLGTRLKVEMELDRSLGGLSGSYAYERSPERLLLEGSVADEGLVVLVERTADGDETGRFEGRFGANGRFAGTWKDAKGLRMFPFILEPVRAPPPPPTNAWAGDWHEDAGSGEIVVKALEDGRIRARGWKTVEVGTEGGSPYANIGHFHAIASVRNGVAVLRDGECRVTLALLARTLHVESAAACGGAGVTFSGDYR